MSYLETQKLKDIEEVVASSMPIETKMRTIRALCGVNGGALGGALGGTIGMPLGVNVPQKNSEGSWLTYTPAKKESLQEISDELKSPPWCSKCDRPLNTIFSKISAVAD